MGWIYRDTHRVNNKRGVNVSLCHRKIKLEAKWFKHQLCHICSDFDSFRTLNHKEQNLDSTSNFL